MNAVRPPTPRGQTPVRAVTPLAAAVVARQRGASQTLIRLGAVVTGEKGWEPPHALQSLILAASSREAETDWIRELLAAAPKEGFPEGLLDHLLYQVVELGRREAVIPLLVEAGARVDAFDGVQSERQPLLLRAAMSSSVRVLELLIAAKADLNATNREGATALHLATQRGLTNFIAPLLRAGADPNRLGPRDETPLSLARRNLAVFREARTERVVAPLDAPAGTAVGAHAGSDPGFLMKQVWVPRMLTSDGDRRNYDQWIAVETLLLAAGAREDVVQRLGIHLRRGEVSSQFLSRAGDDPAPGLAEILALAFLGQNRFSWPDLSAIRVFRLTEDGKAERVLPVPADWPQQDGCHWSFPLEWGDTVEIPEVDRVQNAKWPGLAEPAELALWRCSARRVALTIKDETFPLELRPAPVRGVAAAERIRDGDGAGASTPPGVEAGGRLNTCWLGEVLQGTGRLRISSDRARVGVTRKATGQTWTLNVETDPRASRFWLIDGDHIEVPEKAP